MSDCADCKETEEGAERMSAKLTPWFQWPTKPVRPGMYRVQDKTMNCGCCWINAHWDGSEWHTDLHGRGTFRNLFFDSQMKRWRGLMTESK